MFPKRESDLVTWSNNFNTLISADPVAYGLDIGQAAAYTTLHNAFVSAFQTANDPGTRTPSSIVTKDDAKEALLENARELARIIQADPSVTNTQRSDLGLTVRDTEPTPIPPPATAPDLDIVSAVARTVRLRLHDLDNPTRRGRPDGVAGASIFSFVGDTPPVELSDWTFEGSTTRTVHEIEFEPEVENGATVWLTAYWFNPRMQPGPAAGPVSTNLPGGLAQAA